MTDHDPDCACCCDIEDSSLFTALACALLLIGILLGSLATFTACGRIECGWSEKEKTKP